MYRSVVNELQPLYRVPGHDDTLIVPQSVTPACSSEISLQLKPEKQPHLPPLQTPSRTEGSEHSSWGRVADNAGSTEKPPSDRGTVGPGAYPQTDLDKAIEEAQATKDLVSVGRYDHIDYALTVV